MGVRLRVSNLSDDFDNDYLEDIFYELGEVESARIILDSSNGRSRGYGIVIMATAEDANKSVQHLDGTSHKGKTINVNLD